MASNSFSCLGTHRVQKLEKRNTLCGCSAINFTNLHVRDCPLEARYNMPNKRKLESRTASIYFVGDLERTRGYKLYYHTTRTIAEIGMPTYLRSP